MAWLSPLLIFTVELEPEGLLLGTFNIFQGTKVAKTLQAVAPASDCQFRREREGPIIPDLVNSL